MLLRWPALAPSCLILLWLGAGGSGSGHICPTVCSCGPDPRGRRRTTCVRGGLTLPLPLLEMDLAMEILEIGAPLHHPNAIHTLTALFQAFKSLEELYVTHSGVVQIGMHAFWGVPSLRVLDLCDNNITVVLDHNFRGLANLEELRLDDNRIERLATGAFRHLAELKVLTLQRNLLTELEPRLFLKLSKLQVLRLSGNPLVELNPEVFKDVLELRVFECRGCGLSRINTQMYHLMPYITHLDLGNNQMQFLDTEEFVELHRLRSLHLDGNQLPVVLERTFANNVHLRNLCLARNRLAKITNTAFLNLSNLIDLDIGYNKLDRLETISFLPLADKLQRLVMSGNPCSSAVIGLVLKVVSNVRELGLADMSLTDFPVELGDMTRLLRLNISGNLLANVTWHTLPARLASVDLSRNRFYGLTEHALQYLNKLEEVHLSNNSWTCDLCHIKPTLSSVNSSTFLRNATCSAPKHLHSRLLRSISLTELSACNTASVQKVDNEFLTFVRKKLGLILGGAALVVFLIMCVLFVVWSCWRRHQVTGMQVKEKREKEIETIMLDTLPFTSKSADINFKFPLDLTTTTTIAIAERKMSSVSTIDEIKHRTETDHLHARLPNGNAPKPQNIV